MEQQSDDVDPSDAGAPDDGAVRGEEGKSIIERHFLLVLALALGVAGVAGVGVTYADYSRVGETIQSIPYVGEAVGTPGKVPYADQIRGVLPFVGGTDTEELGPGETGSFAQLKGLVVNPAGSQGNRYLAVSIAFEARAASVKSELETKKVVVKDAVLRLLSERTAEELANPELRDDLKKSLLSETNRILNDGEVDRLYFTEFVLQ